MSFNTSAGDRNRYQGAENYYGQADLARDQANGMSNEQIKANMAANSSRFRDQSTIDMINALGSSSSSGGGGGGGGYTGGSVGAGAGAFNPADVNFNPGGIDMGGSAPSWSNEDFIRGLAKERAESFTESSGTNQNSSITNNIEQNIGNKGDWETNIGDNNTINNSLIGNDYSLNMGSINVANNQNQFAL